MTLWDRLLTNPSTERGLHYWDGPDVRFRSWAALLADAEKIAAGLQRHGVGPGSSVGGVLTNTPESVTGLMAVWLAGSAFVSLPDQARGMAPGEYADQLALLADHAGAELLLVDDHTGYLAERGLGAIGHRPWGWLDSLSHGRALPGTPPDVGEPAFVQYSSGSTGRPKGCVLTPRAIDAQIDIIVALTGGEHGRETMVSWVPLSHDMGMFGCLFYPWALAFDFVMSSPIRFVFSPRTWFEDMATYGGTITAGTSTGLSVAVQAQRSAHLPGSLRPLKSCVIGAEPNDPAVFRRAIETFAPSGLRPHAFISAYGLAEATLAVSGTPLDQAPRSVTVDRYALEEHKVVGAEPGAPESLELASCGPPCPGVSVRAGDPGELAEIEVASPSLADGYRADPELTAQRFGDGRLRTADLGFVDGEDVVVLGRADDMIVLGGRNLYAPQIERAIGDAIGVRPSRVVVLDVAFPLRRGLVAVVEPREPDADHRQLAEVANRAVLECCGVDLEHWFVAAKGGLPRTPTGKTQRQRCRNMIQDGHLDTIADVNLSSRPR